MPRLQILPGNIANMIAAGEVVQRPASVVKELVENAVDAGATSVTVVVKDAGRTLIQVIDNGCGMSPTDALLCFERHATSKIATAEDLNEIMTYGFRGEALASIASVAEVTLRTRRAADEVATQVVVSSFNHYETSQVSAPAGSNFAVRNLFYNTPARRKFLKSDNVELKHIIEEFTRVALTRVDVGFSLNSNGRDVFVLKPAKSLKYRILDILGSGVVGEVVDIELETPTMHLSGFVGNPGSARKTQGNQFFFVNGRFFRSNYLHKAVMKAYEDFIPEGMTPSYFLYLEVDPHSIDVNIHPTKTEIKFEDDSVIFQVLYASIRETLGRNSFGASIDFDSAGSVQMPVLGKDFDSYRSVTAPVADFDPDYNPFEQQTPPSDYDFSRYDGGSDAPATAMHTGSVHMSGDCNAFTDKTQNYGKLFEDRVLPSTRLLTIQDRYIVSAVQSGLMVINIRRARERVLYERFISAVTGSERAAQASLFPVQVNVGVENRLIFDENAAMLQTMGFDISAFGTDTVVVNGVPEGYSCEPGKVQTMVGDLLAVLSDNTSTIKEMMDSAMALKLAKVGASSAPGVSSPAEAQALVDSLLSCANAEFTATGQRVISIITAEDLDKRF